MEGFKATSILEGYLLTKNLMLLTYSRYGVQTQKNKKVKPQVGMKCYSLW
jgi:hypothetical protein